MNRHQVECFKINMKFWKFLGIWPIESKYRFFKYYSLVFVSVFIILYDFLGSINFYFLPRQLDIFVGELILYFSELAVLSKVLTFYFLRNNIEKILEILEGEMFGPDDGEAAKVVDKAKIFIIRYWKIVAVISVTSNITHMLAPLFMHLYFPIPLVLPVCSYSFLSDETRESFIYPLYFYQCFGIHFHMLNNMNIDSFLLGLMILIIAQLEILDAKLRNVTCYCGTTVADQGYLTEREASIELALNKCIIHYDQISKFCSLVQDVFSATLLVQFGMSSCILCVCLFRFTLPAPVDYYVFLATYTAVMIVQIMLPCWFGTRIIDKSTLLSTAIYNCDWTPRTRQFKSSLRLFVERANKPLSITGGKMFPLSLETFTSIMNSAYSFFTLLRHMQSQDL